MLDRFRTEIAARLSASTWLRPLEIGDAASDSGRGFLTEHSIVSFQVLGQAQDGSRAVLGSDASRRIFEWLNQDVSARLPDLHAEARAVLRQEFHIGQPVDRGAGPDQLTVLRLVIGMRFFTIVGLAGPSSIRAALEFEISDMARAIDKLEVLAANGGRLAADSAFQRSRRSATAATARATSILRVRWLVIAARKTVIPSTFVVENTAIPASCKSCAIQRFSVDCC